MEITPLPSPSEPSPTLHCSTADNHFLFQLEIFSSSNAKAIKKKDFSLFEREKFRLYSARNNQPNHAAEWKRIPAAKKRDSNITMASEEHLQNLTLLPLYTLLKAPGHLKYPP